LIIIPKHDDSDHDHIVVFTTRMGTANWKAFTIGSLAFENLRGKKVMF